MSADKKPATLRLRLFPRGESAVRSGHPWVFKESIREQNREGQRGEMAVLFDAKDRFMGMGLYDPDSPFRVRMLHAGKPVPVDAAWWRDRMLAARARREGLFGPETDGYRWISGENDGWPGLVLDRYAGTCVLKLYSGIWLPRLAEITDLVREIFTPQHLVLRLSRNVQAIARTEYGAEEGWLGEPGADTVIFQENGLKFEAQVRQGQKTGFFLDQRDNRLRVQSVAAGREVLNAFSFTGGFSVYAARGGARSVTDLDISPHAIAEARRNFALNTSHPKVAAAVHDAIQADAFAWMAEGPTRGFGLIITDPPSLAKREIERAGAISAYEKLAVSAIRRLHRNGILVAASCSAHVSTEEFLKAVRRAALKSSRPHTELWTTAHAPDHPATYPEANYLKCIALQFS